VGDRRRRPAPGGGAFEEGDDERSDSARVTSDLREAARRFAAAGGGSLIAVSAPAALLGEAEVGPYAATTAAVLRLVESLAREMEAFGGRANALLPGTMDTPGNRAAMPRADASRWVSTEAVAEVVYHLTTPAARAINGAAIRVPGRAL
jgi:NAD(P)-dependent dehydrogenase (short-subunit alcohol dehydrogenase family)